MDSQLLSAYLNASQPFGPADASDILERSAAAALFEQQNRSFDEMMEGRSVIIRQRVLEKVLC